MNKNCRESNAFFNVFKERFLLAFVLFCVIATFVSRSMDAMCNKKARELPTDRSFIRETSMPAQDISLR